MISQLFFYLHASTTDGVESENNYSFVGILVHVYVPLAFKEPNEATYIAS